MGCRLGRGFGRGPLLREEGCGGDCLMGWDGCVISVGSNSSRETRAMVISTMVPNWA